MILILSNALAKRWKVKPVALADVPAQHPAFVWRADWFQVARTRSNVICVNEHSCFSFILLDQMQMSFKKTALNLLNRIGDTLHQAGVAEDHILQGLSGVCFVKHPNPKVISFSRQKSLYTLAAIRFIKYTGDEVQPFFNGLIEPTTALR